MYHCIIFCFVTLHCIEHTQHILAVFLAVTLRSADVDFGGATKHQAIQATLLPQTRDGHWMMESWAHNSTCLAFKVPGSYLSVQMMYTIPMASIALHRG